MKIYSPQITQWNDSNIGIFRKYYHFLNQVDSSKVQIILNMIDDNFDNIPIIKNIVIVSTMTESPRYEKLVELAKVHTEVQFICLADVEFYNFMLPSNITFFKYRHFHLYLKLFLENTDVIDNLIPVKFKKVTKKFSSLSYFNRQIRAFVTVCLLKYAKNDSLISWHNESWSTQHDYLIDTLRCNPRYADLPWNLLDKKYHVDELTSAANYTTQRQLKNFAFEMYYTSLINFSNETAYFGLYQVDDLYYLRPGPFLTEKTWSPLLAGNILFSTASPYAYQYLINDYKVPINYSIGLDFDYILGDLGRFDAIDKKIQELSSINLKDLIDQNIDNCELIQKTIINPDYTKQFDQFNLQQDLKILEKISQL
jgi:hypothetical protein